MLDGEEVHVLDESRGVVVPVLDESRQVFVFDEAREVVVSPVDEGGITIG